MAVHLSNKVTAAGDEIGYLFKRRMLSKGGQTFTAFAEDMTKTVYANINGIHVKLHFYLLVVELGK